MPYTVKLMRDAMEHLKSFSAYHRRIIVAEIEKQLSHAPTDETYHKKQLEPNRLARWELRVGDYRVFYDVVESDRRVPVVAIGRKVHERLLIGGREVEL